MLVLGGSLTQRPGSDVFVWVWKLVGIGRFMKALEWGDWEAR